MNNPNSKGMTRKQRARLREQQERLKRSRPRGPPATDACIKALGRVAVSGFLRVSNRLERTCVELSNACREGAPWAVKVMRWSMGNMLPVRLQRFWPRTQQERQALVLLAASRLKERKIIKFLLFRHNDHIGQDFMWPVGVEKVHFDLFDRDISQISWPSTVREIVLSDNFSHSIENVVWPSSLQSLEFGDDFNSSVEGVNFPPRLQQLIFGESFNQPIARVDWRRLRSLEFGQNFNR